MVRRLLFVLCFSCWPNLPAQDVSAAQALLKSSDSALDWFQVLDEKRIDAGDSVLLLEAARNELKPGDTKRTPVPGSIEVGVFVIHDSDKKIRLVLDRFPLAGL